MLEHTREVFEMNKKIIIGLIALLGVIAVFYLMMAQANAQGFPCPISGRVITYPAGGAIGWTVELYEKTTNALLKSYTVNEYSEYAIDIGDMRACKDGDSFILKVVECADNPICTKTVSFSGGGIIADFDLTTVELPPIECPPEEICPPENQTDTTPYEKCDSCCPVPTSCIDQGYILPENCPVKECPDPTKLGYDWLTFITGAGIMGLLSFLAVYFSAFKGRVRIQTKLKYITSTGRTAYKWVTRFYRED